MPFPLGRRVSPAGGWAVAGIELWCAARTHAFGPADEHGSRPVLGRGAFTGCRGWLGGWDGHGVGSRTAFPSIRRRGASSPVARPSSAAAESALACRGGSSTLSPACLITGPVNGNHERRLWGRRGTVRALLFLRGRAEGDPRSRSAPAVDGVGRPYAVARPQGAGGGGGARCGRSGPVTVERHRSLAGGGRGCRFRTPADRCRGGSSDRRGPPDRARCRARRGRGRPVGHVVVRGGVARLRVGVSCRASPSVGPWSGAWRGACGGVSVATFTLPN